MSYLVFTIREVDGTGTNVRERRTEWAVSEAIVDDEPMAHYMFDYHVQRLREEPWVAVSRSEGGEA